MKATEAKLLDFLKKSPQFVIPIYQRTYSWTEKECRQLWDDIVRCGSSDDIAVHFVGSIVYIDKADSNISTWEPLLVIDGQQRLTTVTLLIAALADVIADDEPVDGFSAQHLRGYYLMNPLEKGDRRFKLVLSETDKDSLISIVGQSKTTPIDESIRISQNFELFQNLIASSRQDIVSVCKGLAKLMIVDIKLKRGEDNPQLIFESMNSTGKALSQADLIRNYILMGLDHDLQSDLYERYWRPMELEFGQVGYAKYFDNFMRYYLTLQMGDMPNVAGVYEAFKEYAHVRMQRTGNTPAHVESLVHNIREFAGYFCAMALDAEPDNDLSVAFHDLSELKVDVAYPLLLELYHDYQQQILPRTEFLMLVRLIESYVFRRAVCGIETNSMNKTFPALGKGIEKSNYVESLNAAFQLLPSYRRFPTDDEFFRNLHTRDLYNFPRQKYWLRRLENHGRKERVDVKNFTVEHILPQNENLSQGWQTALGPDWKRIQKEYLHTLGNLTLTAYNSEFSDKTFIEKREMPSAPEKGLSRSPLNLNQGLGHLPTWDERNICARADWLAKIALSVWSGPNLSDQVLDTYKVRSTASKKGTKSKVPNRDYSLQDHPNLFLESLYPVYLAFRDAVLELDSCITESFLKDVVSYAADSPIVEIYPQKSRLRLTLNMPFTSIHDPRKLCNDVSEGRWSGTGDVQVPLKSLADLPYIMQLVRQAFDYQLSGGGDE